MLCRVIQDGYIPFVSNPNFKEKIMVSVQDAIKAGKVLELCDTFDNLDDT